MTIMLIPFSQGWDGNRIVQFTNVISPVGNESGCWVASPPLDAKFGWSENLPPKHPGIHLIWDNYSPASQIIDRSLLKHYNTPRHKFSLGGEEEPW